MTCQQCIHYMACRSMVEAMGYIFRGPGVDADKFCEEFERGWRLASEEKPQHSDMVLVICSGQWEGITFQDAYQLANYNEQDGWILEAYPAWEDPQVSLWRELPGNERS